MAKTITFDVETSSNMALSEIFETKQLSIGSSLREPHTDSKLLLVAREQNKGFGLGEMASFGIQIGEHLGEAILAAWIYEMLKDRVRRVILDNEIYRITKKDMERFVHDVIELLKKQD